MRKFKYKKQSVIELSPKRRIVRMGHRKKKPFYLAFPYIQFAHDNDDDDNSTRLKICCSVKPVESNTIIMPLILPNMTSFFTYCLSSDNSKDFNDHDLESLVNLFWNTSFDDETLSLCLADCGEKIFLDGKKVKSFNHWEELSTGDEVGLTYRHLQWNDEGPTATFDKFMTDFISMEY